MTRRTMLVLAGILLLAGCIYVYRYEEPSERSWPAAGITAVNATTQNGAIKVSAGTDSLAMARITRRCWANDKEDGEEAIRNIVVTDSLANGTLSLRAEMPRASSRNYGADLELTVPGLAGVNLNTSNGRVEVNGLTGGGRVATSNGELVLGNARGEFHLTTSNGRIKVANHQGSLEARTSNGEVNCDLSAVSQDGAVRLKTSNGRVLVYLPSDIGCRFDAGTSNGSITVSGFGEVTYTVHENNHKVGRIGNGGVEVMIETSNGAVEIRGR